VLVIHEIFGLTDWVRCHVRSAGRERGHRDRAPDLLSGQTFADPDGARKAISALPEPQIKADLDATSDYALKIPRGQRHPGGMRILVGAARLGLPIRKYESETESSLLVLWNCAG